MVEFNARFGDPETQVVLDRLASPLGPLLAAAAAGDLAGAAALEWRPGAAVVVVIAAEGYPADPVKGDEITGAERAGQDHAYLLHAGTARERQGRPGIGGRPGAERGRLGARRRGRARPRLRARGNGLAAGRLVPPGHSGTPVIEAAL